MNRFAVYSVIFLTFSAVLATLTIAGASHVKVVLFSIVSAALSSGLAVAATLSATGNALRLICSAVVVADTVLIAHGLQRIL